MFSIKIGQTHLDLPEDFEINLIFENKIFERNSFDVLFTFPFEFLNTPKNRKALGFPEELKILKNAFVDKTAFLCQKGNLIEKGILRVSNWEKGRYQADFRGAISNLEKYHNSTLQEILGNTLFDFGKYTQADPLVYNAEIDPLADFVDTVVKFNNDDLKSEIVFPFVKINEVVYNDYQAGCWVFIPFLKLVFIIKAVFNKIGYKFIDTYSSLCPDFDKIILANTKILSQNTQIFNFYEEEVDHRVGDSVAFSYKTEIYQVYLDRFLKISDNLPAMKFKDFLTSLQNLLGLDFDFDHIYQTVKINFFRDIFNQKKQKDWTSKAEPCSSVSGNDYEGFNFSFKSDSNDQEQKELLEKLPKKIIDQINTPDDVVDNDSSLKSKIFYAKKDRKYYQINEQYYGLTANFKAIFKFPLEYVADEFFDKKIDAGKETIETEFQPIRMANYKDCDWQDKIRIYQTPLSTIFPICFEDQKAISYVEALNGIFGDKTGNFFPRKKLFFLIKNSEILMQNLWIEIPKISLVDPLVPDIPRLFYLNYPMDQANATDIYGKTLDSNFEIPDLEIKLRVFLAYYLPSFYAKVGANQSNFTEKPNYLSVNKKYFSNYFLANQASSMEQTEIPARILLFHGNQTFEYKDFDSNGFERTHQALMPYASPDNTAPNGKKISEFTLRWNGEDNLVDCFWKEYLAFQKNKKTAEYTLRLNEVDLLNFKKTDKIRINDVVFFVKKMEKTYSKKGLHKVKCTLESISAGVCEHDVNLNIYQTEEEKTAIITKKTFLNP